MAGKAIHVSKDSQVDLDRDGDQVTVIIDGEEVVTGEFPAVEQVTVDTDTLLNREKQQP